MIHIKDCCSLTDLSYIPFLLYSLVSGCIPHGSVLLITGSTSSNCVNSFLTCGTPSHYKNKSLYEFKEILKIKHIAEEH